MASPEASTFQATMKWEPQNSGSSLLGPQLSFLSHHSQPCHHKLPENKGTSLTLPSVPHLVCHQSKPWSSGSLYFSLVNLIHHYSPTPKLFQWALWNSWSIISKTPCTLTFTSYHSLPSLLVPGDTTSPAVLVSCNVSSLRPYLLCITSF